MNGTADTRAAWPRRALLAVGLALAVAAGLGCYPAAVVGTAVSPDGVLEPATSALMRASQHLMAALLLLAAALPGSLARRLCRAADAMERVRSGWPFGVLAAVAALAVQQLVFSGMPHITDATSHWFQARILAAGHLAAPLPACHEFFAQHNVIMSPSGLWHTKYFPGQALFLALGFLLHLPWLVMPAGWGWTVMATCAVTERVFDRATARWSGLLLALSPMGALLAGSFMSHSTFLMFSASALYAAMCAVDRMRGDRDSAGLWFSAGLLAGMAALTRPQDMVTPALLVLGCLATMRGAWGLAARALPAAALGALIPLAFLMAWNVALYGAPLASGYHFGSSGSLTPVIHDAFGLTPTHTVGRAVAQAGWSLFRLNQALFGWPVGLLIAALAFSRSWDRRDAIVLAAAASPVALYFFFPYCSSELEARYYAPAVPLLAVLAARGLLRFERPGGTRWAVAAALVFMAHAALHYWPAYLVPRYAHDYEEAGPGLRRAAREARLQGAIVLVPDAGYDRFRYSAGFVWTDPWLRGDVIYARDLGRDYDCLRRAHPALRLYRFVPDARWQNGTFLPVDG